MPRFCWTPLFGPIVRVLPCAVRPSGMFEVEITELNTRERSLLRHLQREYTPEIARTILLPLLRKESPISLRVLDWTVVNWSPKHNVVCASPVSGELVNVALAYASALSFWKRRLFDPFRRRARLHIRVDGERYETTLGQVNFTLFLHRTVYAYVLRHVQAIEDDMNRASAKHKRERRDAVRSGMPCKRGKLATRPGYRSVAYVAPSHVRVG